MDSYIADMALIFARIREPTTIYHCGSLSRPREVMSMIKEFQDRSVNAAGEKRHTCAFTIFFYPS